MKLVQFLLPVTFFPCPSSVAYSDEDYYPLVTHLESTSSSFDSTSTSTSSTSDPSSTSVPGFVFGNRDFTLLGCYAEPDGGRALSNRYTSDSLTVEECLAVADGYDFAGIEYGRECWYGNSLTSGTAGADSSECQMTCGGDAMEYCGGGFRMVLYSTNGAPTAPATQPPLVDGASFYACMTEATNERALSGANYANDSMSLAQCAAYCPLFKYFGVEYV